MAVLPRDLDVLARVFPVLQEFGDGHRSLRAKRRGSVLEMRRWAFDALRDLLARLSAQRPVVLFIDDLQWGDADSHPFFEGLLRPPAPPGLLVVASYRTSDAAGAPLVETLLGARTSRRTPAEVRLVDLAPLDEADARELVRALLPDGAETSAATIARHAAGSPLFLTQLALSFAGDAALDLGGALRQRLDGLPNGSRQLVEAVATAGRPTPVTLALCAADVGAEGDALLVRLCAAQLLRLAGADRVEVYHDRIREVVLAELPGSLLAARHARWLDTLVAAGLDEPGALLMHALGAGLSARAAEYALRGAEQAVTALAFDRAADLFRIALEQGELGAPTRRSVLRQRADALASAGQVRAAADPTSRRWPAPPAPRLSI